jgi:hypothetical protein
MARVGGTFRGSVETVHGFPILQTGLTDSTVLRALLDIENWFESMGVSKGRDIVATRKLVHKKGLIGWYLLAAQIWRPVR